MVLENKLGITESAKLAREEERISKIKAIELFTDDLLQGKLSAPLRPWPLSIIISLAIFMNLLERFVRRT